MCRINNQKFRDMLIVHELEMTKGEKDAGYLWAVTVVEPWKSKCYLRTFIKQVKEEIKY